MGLYAGWSESVHMSLNIFAVAKQDSGAESRSLRGRVRGARSQCLPDGEWRCVCLWFQRVWSVRSWTAATAANCGQMSKSKAGSLHALLAIMLSKRIFSQKQLIC